MTKREPLKAAAFALGAGASKDGMLESVSLYVLEEQHVSTVVDHPNQAEMFIMLAHEWQMSPAALTGLIHAIGSLDELIDLDAMLTDVESHGLLMDIEATMPRDGRRN